MGSQCEVSDFRRGAQRAFVQRSIFMIKLQSSGVKLQGLGVKTFNLRVSAGGWRLDILNGAGG